MKFTVISVLVVLSSCLGRIEALPDEIIIGGLFNNPHGEQALAFKYAIEAVNLNKNILPHSRLRSIILDMSGDDPYYAERQVCRLLQQEGIAALFGPQSPNTANHIQSMCDTMKVPHIETRWAVPEEARNSLSINLHPYSPSLSRAYRDIMDKLQWASFVLLYEDNDGLERITSLLKDAPWNFVLRKLDPNNEYRPMLKEIKLSKISDIVIDVSKEKIPEIFRQGEMVGIVSGYYRYFITNLDLYLVDLAPFSESGVNITGIQLIDPESDNVKMLVEDMRRYYHYKLPVDYMISTDAALMYDSVELFATALTNLEYEQRGVDIRELLCQGNSQWQHGSSLVRSMKMYSRPVRDPNYGRLPGSSMQPQPPYRPNPWMGMDSRRGRGNRGGRVSGMDPYYHQQGRMYNSSMASAQQYDQMRVSGISGWLKFSDEGFRDDFELNIMEIDKGIMNKVGKWTHLRGANFTRTWDETVLVVEQDLRNKTLIVSIAVTKPYVVLKQNVSENDDDIYDGFCVELVKEIAKRRGFKVKFVMSPGGNYGNIDKETGEWNGIVGQLIEHKADLGIVDLTITAARAEAVDFSMPFMNLGISIVFTKPKKKPQNLLSFMLPFSSEVWIYMATAYLGVSVLLFILARMAPDEWDCPYPCIDEPEELENSFTLLNSMWFIIGTFLCQGADIAPKMSPEEWTNPYPCIDDPEELENCFNMLNSLWFVIATFLCQGADIAPRAVSTRIVASIWWFFTLIMISSYTANLAASLTVGRMDSPIKSAEDLAKQTKIKYGCKYGGSTYDFFKHSNISVYKKMWQAMESTVPSVFPKSNDQGVARVQKSDGMYAFLMESASIEYEVQRKCDLMQIGGLLDSKSYGIALPPGSKYRDIISGEVLRLNQEGFIQLLKIKWWEDDSCPTEVKKDAASAAELGLESVGGVFVVMTCGIVLACVIACCEFMWKARKIATDDGVSFGEELCKELLFVIHCRENSKPVRKTPLPATDSSSIYGSSNYGYSEKN